MYDSAYWLTGVNYTDCGEYVRRMNGGVNLQAPLAFATDGKSVA